jgi:hypothetical protein
MNSALEILELEVVTESASEFEATVLLRSPHFSTNRLDNATVRGPFCRVAHTLPASFKLEAAHDGWWRARLIDPCFWSPDYPALYQLRWNELPRASHDEAIEFGVRRLAVERATLRWNGRRWILRAAESHAVHEDSVNSDSWVSWHEAGLARVITRPAPDPKVCRAAARQGVVLVGRPAATDTLSDPLLQLRRWAAWTAVSIVIMPAEADLAREAMQRAAPGLVFLAELTDDSKRIPNWCHGLVAPAQVERLTEVRQLAPGRLLVARGELSRGANIAAARRACEQLQRELPRELELGGYLVGGPGFAGDSFFSS